MCSWRGVGILTPAHAARVLACAKSLCRLQEVWHFDNAVSILILVRAKGVCGGKIYKTRLAVYAAVMQLFSRSKNRSKQRSCLI